MNIIILTFSMLLIVVNIIFITMEDDMRMRCIEVFNVLIGIIIFVSMCILITESTTLEVYQSKTKLQTTHKEKVSVDSVEIYKNK